MSIDGDGNDDNGVRKTSFSEHFKNITLGIAAICVPVVGYIYADQQNQRQIKAASEEIGRQAETSRVLAQAQARAVSEEKDRELAKSYVDLAIGILKQKGTGQYDPVRDWAVRVVNHNIDVKLDQLAQNSLVGQSLNDPHGYDLVYYEVGRDGRPTNDGQLEILPHDIPMPDLPRKARRTQVRIFIVTAGLSTAT